MLPVLIYGRYNNETRLHILSRSTKIHTISFKKRVYVMAKIGVFYGSTTANTVMVVTTLNSELARAGFEVESHNIAGGDIKSMESYDLLVLATPTWTEGELQEDWKKALHQLGSLDFTGKRVALVGLGDQVNYPDHFADAIAELAEYVYLGGGQIVGQWPVEGYKFNKSAAVEDGRFVGLVLDQNNERELTAERIRDWAGMLQEEFAGY